MTIIGQMLTRTVACRILEFSDATAKRYARDEEPHALYASGI
ncbi:hypothetical protein BJ988_004819 [Nocardioides panzhihuensis]|uniref:Uncharacterized protein n=1 Tax=Nocardioides panzhihuensis TaxID=860243 RepID=A0A7Z0DQX4_9ACTN|nr:hypothetical protein [Nocardioides panzhihuensis]